MPVSSTTILISCMPWGKERPDTAKVIVPDEVNLRALLSKLLRICFILNTSPISFSGNGATSRTNSNFLLCADFAMRVTISSNSLLGENGWLLICSLPASILEKSKTSFTIVSRLSAAVSMIRTCSCCSVGKAALVNSRLNPKIAFSGVLISWLILARNCDLTLLAFMASLRAISSLAFCSSISSILLRKSSVACATSSSNWLRLFSISANENKPDSKNTPA